MQTFHKLRLHYILGLKLGERERREGSLQEYTTQREWDQNGNIETGMRCGVEGRTLFMGGEASGIADLDEVGECLGAGRHELTLSIPIPWFVEVWPQDPPDGFGEC